MVLLHRQLLLKQYVYTTIIDKSSKEQHAFNLSYAHADFDKHINKRKENRNRYSQ